MFSVYILNSVSFQKSYVGQTGDLGNRLQEHNSAENKGYTNRFKPWVLIHSECFPTRTEAIMREKFFKTGVGREQIKLFIFNYIIHKH